jgi:hypothetical protein
VETATTPVNLDDIPRPDAFKPHTAQRTGRRGANRADSRSASVLLSHRHPIRAQPKLTLTLELARNIRLTAAVGANPVVVHGRHATRAPLPPCRASRARRGSRRRTQVPSLDDGPLYCLGTSCVRACP